MMKRPNRLWLLWGLLAVAFVGSVGSNVVLFIVAKTYFEQSNAIRLDPLGLDLYPTEVEKGDEPMIVFCGDSRIRMWPTPERIGEAVVFNRGIGNQTTEQVLGRFHEHVLALEPALVVLQVGVNDLKTIPLFPERKEKIIRNCKANIDRLVELSVDKGSRVVLTTIFPLGRVPLVRRPFWSSDVARAIDDVNTHLKTLESDRVTVFETASILTNAEGVVAREYSRDLLHLEPAGYAALDAAMADLLMP